MFNYGVDWLKRTIELIPIQLRKSGFIMFTYLPVVLIKQLYNVFLQFRSQTIYNAVHTSQIIYLTKLLNDRFDNYPRRIYIENTADIYRVFIYNKAEQRPPVYLYNKWNLATPYLIDEKTVFKRRIYQSLTNNTNKQPDTNTSDWQDVTERLWFKNKTELFAATHFIVWVPLALTFDVNEMKALINFYKLAGKNYLIQTY